MIKIFLDDVRQPEDCLGYMHQRIGSLNPIYREKWEIVRNFDEFVSAIGTAYMAKIEITHISFDHDLADIHYDPTTNIESFEYQEKTGLDCAIWFKEFYEKNSLELPVMFVHSMNPVGTKNIIDLFK